MKNVDDFGKVRRLLWPIYAYELKKVIPMLMMFFFISFNYSTMRGLKDSLILTAPGGGATVLSALKLYGVIPAAIIFMLIYAKLSNTLSKQSLFYVTLTPFVLFFILFNFLLYPYQNTIHPHEIIAPLQEAWPQFFYGMLSMVRNWSFSLFYIFAELWGSVVLSLMFWGFANDTTQVHESKRFYALFGIGANLALDIAGRALSYYKDIGANVPVGQDAFQITLNGITLWFTLGTLCVVFLYWWINRYVLTDPRFYDTSKIKKKKKKPKLSLVESFKLLIHSKYLGYIAILVITYGISINLIEVVWKEHLVLQFPSKNELAGFMGQYFKYVAWTTIFMMLFVSSNVTRFLGWKVAALFTPTVLLITGVIFFGMIIFIEDISPLVVALGTTPLYAAVIAGTIQNVMSKATKYALFDPTKEMTYIPLDEESKVKGKAAIDVVGARLGKAGGSAVQQFMFAFATLSVATPYIGLVVLMALMLWIYAVLKLDVEFTKKNKKEQ